jgi:glycosyltransferase involved in cell wall biosynthesis
VPALLSLEAAVGTVSVFHGTTYSVPARHRAPLVITVHDLALLRHPALGSRGLRAMVDRAVRDFGRADRLIAVSEATRADLVDLCGADPARISVIYNGCARDFHPRDRAACLARTERLLGPGPFLLHVGTLEPRKNLPNLIHAFAQLRRERNIPHRLVLAGEPGWGGESLADVAADAGVADRVSLPGRVGTDLLPVLYCAADVFVYPSLYEGFGLPVLEAMACGTPVVASDRAALPEITGGCALLIDPTDPDDLARAIGQCLDEPARAASMTAAGLARASQFSWERAAGETLAVYTAVIGAAR